MARFYSNENFPLPVILELRKLGHDVLTTADAGKSGQSVSDEDVLLFAIRESRAVITINRKHFIRLHKQDATHHGIVVCTLDLDFSGQARRIHDAVKATPDMRGLWSESIALPSELLPSLASLLLFQQMI